MGAFAVAGDDLNLDAGALGRAVADLGLVPGGLPVPLDEHGVVHVGAEGLLDGLEIGLLPVRREPHPLGEPQRQVGDELPSPLRIPPTDKPRRDQLRARADSRLGPHVAVALDPHHFRRDVLLLGVAERPDFIAWTRRQGRFRSTRSW